MVALHNPDYRHADLFGLADGEIHRELGGDLPEAPIAGNERRRRSFLHDGWVGRRDDAAITHSADVAGNMLHPVRVVTGEVGVDEVLGNYGSLLRRGPGRLEELLGDSAEGVGGNRWHSLSSKWL